ncbi:NAD(P)-dependent oxidoreductase [Flindersiella endophytica]
MTQRIVVFGAGGRAGRTLLVEATARGHQVTGVVREPSKYSDLTVVAGDVTDPASVAAVAAGHDVAIHAAASLEPPHDVYFVSAVNALLAGLAEAGVGRLLAYGVGSNLEVSPGVRVMDTPDFPKEYLPFSLGHTAALHVLRAVTTPVDWVMLTPAGDFVPDGEPTGRYRIGGDELPDQPKPLSYADFAIAVLDEIEHPRHHRTRISVAAAD